MTGFVTVREAARKLNVSRQRIYQLIDEGQIHGSTQILEKLAIPEVEIDRLLKERTSEIEHQVA